MRISHGFASLGLILIIVIGLAAVIGSGWWAINRAPASLNQAPDEASITSPTATSSVVANPPAPTPATSSALFNYATGDYDVKYDDFNFDGLQDKVVIPDADNHSDTYRGISA